MSLSKPSARSSIHVVYELAGTVNGAAIEVRGIGSIDDAACSRELDLDLDASPKREAFHCDPKLLTIGSIDGLILATAPMNDGPHRCRLEWLFGSDNLPIHFDTRITVFDDMGREIGTAVVSSLMRGERGDSGEGESERTLELRAQLIEARFRFLPTERVVCFGIPARASVMPASDDSPWTVMTSAWTFETNFGSAYRSVSTTSFEVGSDRRVTETETLKVECRLAMPETHSLSVSISSS